MQSCSQDTAITVTLCTGTSADNGSTVDVSSSAAAPAYTTAASAPSYEAPSSTSSTSAPAATQYNWNNADASKSEAAEVTPTTLVTSVAPAMTTDDAGIVYITEIETVYATADITATAYANRHRRHEHAHGHQHHA